MKVALFLVSLLSLHTMINGLAESGTSEYSVQSGDRCPQTGAGCCTNSSCSLVYSARGEWLTGQDRVADLGACTGACSVHFRKCVELCNCVARQTEVRSTRACKCVLGVRRVLVRNNCVRRCIDGRADCVATCNTGECPLEAVTKMEWKQEFKGRCDGICKRENGLETVCVN